MPIACRLSRTARATVSVFGGLVWLLGFLTGVQVAVAQVQTTTDALLHADEGHARPSVPSPPLETQPQIEQAVIARLDDIEQSVLLFDDTDLPVSAAEVARTLLETTPNDYPHLKALLAEQALALARYDDIPCRNIRDDRLPADFVALVRRLDDQEMRCLYRSLALNALLKKPLVRKIMIERQILEQLQRARDANREFLEDEISIREKVHALLSDLPKSYEPLATLMEREATRIVPYRPVPCRSIKEAQIPAGFSSKLRQLENSAVECELKQAFWKTYYEREIALRQDRLVQEATRLGVFAGDPAPVMRWTGGMCGCAPTSSKIVYGVYPFWLAEKDLQNVDFSTLSRIGYFALTFDEKGQIRELRHWRKKRPFSHFIDKAHKYRTHMDVILYNHAWESWGKFTPEETAVVIDRLSTNVVNMVNVKLTNYLINTLKPYVSFGFSPVRTMGDGVTLYFDFADLRDKDSALVFSSLYALVTQLRTKLDRAGGSFQLNVMFPFSAMVDHDGIYRVMNLKKLMDHVDFFLVVLDDPIDTTMKALRYEIEKRVPSKEQRAMVRKIVPVIAPLGSLHQFENRLTYFDDNFGGVGLWTIPIGEGDKIESVRRAIKEGFLKSSDGLICRVVCPNRWISRMVLFLVLVVTVLYGLLSLWVVEFRRLAGMYSRYIPGIAVLTMMLLGLTVWCDPYWNDRQLEMVFVSLVAGTGAVVWFSVKKRREAEYP